MNDRPPRLAVRILLTAVGYILLARAGNLVAIPPGYATVVWPAAGLAAGLAWVWGTEIWPGIFLGSALGNNWMTWDRGFISERSALLSLWIAAGAAAQAVAAVAAARRAAPGDPLRSGRGAVRFLLVLAPLACVLSASWAAVGMRWVGFLRPEETPYSWATWWAGDTIGVATVAPLVLLWMREDRGGARARRAQATTGMVTILLTVTALQVSTIRGEEQLTRALYSRQLADFALTLRVGMGARVDALQSIADVFAVRASVSRDEFARLSRRMMERHAGVQAVEWRPRVPDARRAEVEATARREGLPDFEFRSLDDAGRIRRAGRSAEYFPILYAEPLRGNEAALGLDVGHQQAEVREAAAHALESRKVSASGGFRLVQEKGHQKGFAVFVPVTDADGLPRGLVEGVFRAGDLMDRLLAGAGAGPLSVQVLDVSDPSSPSTLYRRGAPVADSLETVALSGEVGGRRWRVELSPDAAAPFKPRAPMSWAMLGVMLAGTLVLAWTVLGLLAGSARDS